MPNPYKHGGRWYVRVPRSDRRRIKTSTGTTDKRTAKAIGAMIEALAARGDTALLDAVCARKQALLPLWGEWTRDAMLETSKDALDDADVSLHIEPWRRYLAKRGTASADRYVTHVRSLMPEGVPFPRSQFRRSRIADHLASLDVSPSTRNRHRSALLQFGRYLRQQEVIEFNPVRDVQSDTENRARDVYYAMEDVRRLVNAQPAPFRALGALFAATGIELQAAQRLRRRDVDVERGLLHARGSKTPWRNRTCAITQPWALDILREHVRGLLPDALVFDGLATIEMHKAALIAHHAACKATHLPDSRLHDYRHHFAVDALKRGVSPMVVATQLGHHDATLVLKRYGRYVPNVSELLKGVAVEAPHTERRRAARTNSAKSA